MNSKPVGTGPFKFSSFIPGQQSVFLANHDYWEHGKPYVDKLVVNSVFADETARLNALLSSAINIAPFLPHRARSIPGAHRSLDADCCCSGADNSSLHPDCGVQ